MISPGVVPGLNEIRREVIEPGCRQTGNFRGVIPTAKGDGRVTLRICMKHRDFLSGHRPALQFQAETRGSTELFEITALNRT